MDQILPVIGGLLGLVSLVCYILVVVKMFQNGKTGHGIASILLLFVCGIGVLYAFIYGWTKSGEWGIKPLMTAWTVCFLANIGITAVTLPAQMNQFQKQMQEAQEKMQADAQKGMQPPPVLPPPDMEKTQEAPMPTPAPNPATSPLPQPNP